MIVKIRFQGHVCNAILFFSFTFVVVSLPVSFGIPTSFDSVVNVATDHDKNDVDAIPSNHERVEVEGVWQIVLVVFMVRIFLSPHHKTQQLSGKS